MKLLYFFTASFGILGAAAQASQISTPTSGTTIHAGQSFTVQVVRPMSHQGSIEIGFAISLYPCFNNVCPDPNTALGAILYNGPYRPVLHEQPGRPYENFTVTVPEFSDITRAQLTTGRFHAIGGGPFPILEINSVILNFV